jgi:hypothetical protein
MITLQIEFSAGISGCDRPVARMIQMSFMLGMRLRLRLRGVRMSEQSIQIIRRP